MSKTWFTPENIDWTKAPEVDCHEAMDADTFTHTIQGSDQPIVIKGHVAHWPLTKAANEGPRVLADALMAHDTNRPVKYFAAPSTINGRFFYAENLQGFNFERRESNLRDLLDQLISLTQKPHSEYLYGGAIPVPEHLPGLMDSHQHGLLPAETEQLVSLWLGHHSRTAAHFDLPQNLACVLAGRRRFILMPVSQLANLYVGPLDNTPAGQPISLVDFLQPDLNQHPAFLDALPHALVADLEPGDALYIPSMWFHHVETLDPMGAMLNFWWRDAPAYMFTPMITLMHSLLTLKDLPAAEREAWRTVFDHYVFQRNGAPMEHIPPEARGIFGEMTPEKLQRLKYYLGKSLG